MLKLENWCVGCPPEKGCLGKGCPYVDVPVYYCDTCNNDGATYECEGEDICEYCLDELIKKEWDSKTKAEKTTLLSESELDDLSTEELDDFFESNYTRDEKIELLDISATKSR